MLITFNYKSYFKFLPSLENHYVHSADMMNSRLKKYMTTHYSTDSFIFWLYFKYLNDIYLKTNNVRWRLFKDLNIDFKFVVTTRTSAVLTLVKSPMAMKTWSKEQVGYKYFNINVTLICLNIGIMLKKLNLNKDNPLHLFFIIDYISRLTKRVDTPVMILKYATIRFIINYNYTFL